MARQIQIRRGTAAENDAFTGAIGEVTMDTTNKTLRVHDGVTMGGTVLAKKNEIPEQIPNNYDFVVESQLPTAANNYTWYRKYKSGWIEQGGTINTGSDTKTTITFPISFSILPQVFITRVAEVSIPADNVNKRFCSVTNIGLISFETWGNYSGNGSYWFAVGIVSE